MSGVGALGGGNIRKFCLTEGKYPKIFSLAPSALAGLLFHVFDGRRAQKHAFVSASFWETLIRLPGVVKKAQSFELYDCPCASGSRSRSVLDGVENVV